MTDFFFSLDCPSLTAHKMDIGTQFSHKICYQTAPYTTLEKLRKRLLRPQNWLKITYENWQN